MRIPQPLKMQGYWWLPEKQEERLRGTLIVSDSGDVTLDVLGLFEGGTSPETTDISRIHGVTEKGKLVTLDRCFYRNRDLHFPGIPKGTLHVSLVLFGANFNVGESLRFSQASFSCEGLDTWLGITGISVTHDSEHVGATIHYKPPVTKRYRIKEGVELSIVFRWSSGVSNISEARLTQSAALQLDIVDPM